jgi:PIN domain nuclease of toxin-antitoxin system
MGSVGVRLLLDTHVWIWGLAEPERLRVSTREALDDSSNDLYLSPISVWECLMLAEKQRITLADTALVYRRTLVTSDQHLLEGGGFQTLRD